MTGGKVFPTLSAASFGAFAGGVVGAMLVRSRADLFLLVLFTLVSIGAAIVVTRLLITDADGGRDMEGAELDDQRTTFFPERDGQWQSSSLPPSAAPNGGSRRGRVASASAGQPPYTRLPDQPDANEPPRPAPGPADEGDIRRSPPMPPASTQQPGPLKPAPLTPSEPKPDPPSNQQRQRPGPIVTSRSLESRAVAIPLPPADAANPDPWWSKPSAAGATAADEVTVSLTEKIQARSVSDYQDNTLIAQCPNCGAFEMEARRAGAGFNFMCSQCPHQWYWQPNTAWPEINVAPRLRGPNQP